MVDYFCTRMCPSPFKQTICCDNGESPVAATTIHETDGFPGEFSVNDMPNPLDFQPRYRHVVSNGLSENTDLCRPNISIACETLHIVDDSTEARDSGREACLVRSYGKYGIYYSLNTLQAEICMAQLFENYWSIRMPLDETVVTQPHSEIEMMLGTPISGRTVECNYKGLRIWIIERNTLAARQLINCVENVRKKIADGRRRRPSIPVPPVTRLTFVHPNRMQSIRNAGGKADEVS